ncbi:AAA family ATPase [Orenia marismortui]|uniref:Nuclease SbcCD subunit C n=1 Tax=Orenia marismortui TaxID=46469 RepID=A0A4R8H9H3_9FIRM|nr:AAA family ATPase [Orenia marismortui]TDX52164.1 AAA domain-containing protein [Orenia marismortui]
MKEIRLASLKLKNFKGIKDFELDTQGNNVSVYGDNGAGKTTLFDAFSWLLFDKDSQGNSSQSFDIKTLDEEGNVIHGLEHEVEGVLQINEKKLTLRKTYYEKWTKQRGSAEKKFAGHTTDYFLNEVPVKKSEYDARINEIVDEDIFKLLTNPAYFNEELHWKERRKILMEVCGDISPEEVIAAGEGLDDLQSILSDRSIEDNKKIIASKRKKINKELEKIPVRIDEVTQGLPDIANLNKEDIEAEIKGLKLRKEAKEKKITNIKAGGEIAENRKQLNEIQSELLEIRNNHSSKYRDKIEEVEGKLESARDKYRELQSTIDQKQIEETGQVIPEIKTLEDRSQKLREEWYKVNDEKFEHEDECPTCSQTLPEEQIEEARTKFNISKSKKLEEINVQGKELKSKIEDLNLRKEKLKNDINLLDLKQQDWEKHADDYKKEIQKLKEESKSYQDSQEYQDKLEDYNQLQQEIEQLQDNKSKSADEVKEQIYLLEKEIESNERKLSQIEQYEKGQARIQELADQEKELAKEYSKLERDLYLTEEFIKTKVNLLESKINDKFEFAHFKLFEEQINGELKETCETLFKGVPYGSSLNNAARVNVGLDVINTLSEFYGLSAPIFIDNAESVTELIDVDSQVIELVVSEPDKELRVELEQQEMKEAV